MSKVETIPAWTRISQAFGLTPDDRPTLKEVLSLMEDCDPERIDKHFRPQHLNVFHGVAPLDFVGHIERMDVVTDYLAGYGITLQEGARPYATGANRRLEERLDDEAKKMVLTFYERDFELFGYDQDWRNTAPVVEPDRGHGTRAALRRLITER